MAAQQKCPTDLRREHLSQLTFMALNLEGGVKSAITQSTTIDRMSVHKNDYTQFEADQSQITNIRSLQAPNLLMLALLCSEYNK